MTLMESPYYWSSAHRPVWFTYTYESKSILTYADNGGNLRITINAQYSENSNEVPEVGEFLIITDTASDYVGRWEILTVHSSTEFTLDVPYTGGTVSIYGIKFERKPEIQIYKGYDTGETYDTELPLTLVGTFTPRNSPNNNLRFDVSGYLKSIFPTIPAISGAGVNYEMFNKFRLKFDGSLKDPFFVLNSAIEHIELNEYFVNTGRYLVGEAYPYLMDCGKNVLARINNDSVEITFDTSDNIIDVSP